MWILVPNDFNHLIDLTVTDLTLTEAEKHYIADGTAVLLYNCLNNTLDVVQRSNLQSVGDNLFCLLDGEIVVAHRSPGKNARVFELFYLAPKELHLSEYFLYLVNNYFEFRKRNSDNAIDYVFAGLLEKPFETNIEIPFAQRRCLTNTKIRL